MPTQRSLLFDLFHGALGFAMVSVVAFSVWAYSGSLFGGLKSKLVLYSTIAAVFMLLSGFILSPLAGGLGRFYKTFPLAFLLYSVAWCVAWFSLRGRTGEWIGAAAGCLVFTWVTFKLMGSTRGWLLTAIGVFILHTIGYFAGDWAMYDFWLAPEKVQALTKAKAALAGKLSWGLLYGLGFGAGIGWLYHRARQPQNPSVI